MKIQLKNTWGVIGIIVLAFVFGSLFYWYELRPAKIKHDCSWYKVIDPAKPAKPAITKEDVQASQKQSDECLKNVTKQSTQTNPYSGLFDKSIEEMNEFYAKRDCEKLVKQEHEAILAKPENHWYREAKKTEYDFCLHEHGL